MSTYMNELFWKKSYMIEFQINNVVTDAFTFSVAPENEEFNFPQRVNETKTFGGTVIEDYGNDTIKISFSGSTVNQEIKRIYRGRKPLVDKFMNGEEEIWYIKDLFAKYGKGLNLQNKKVFLYALDSGYKSKWWQVYPQEFQIKRSKDSPMRWNYNFTMLAGAEGTTTDIFSIVKKLTSWVTEIKSAIETIRSFADTLDSYRNYITYFTDALNEVVSILDTVEDAIEAYENVAIGYVEDLTKAVTETTTIGNNIIKSATRLTFGFGSNLYSSVTDLVAAVKNLKEIVASADYTKLINSYLSQYEETTEKIQDVFNITTQEMEDTADEIYADTLKIFESNDVLVIPGTDGEDDQAISVYGFITTTVKDGDTWDSIAADFYGDADNGYIVAAFNNQTPENGEIMDLSAGDVIQIPILQETDKPELNNEVYSLPEEKDNYGHDILISSSGDFGVYNGDLCNTDNVDTLTQAINNRLQTAANSRIRTILYGIKSNIGSNSDASNVFLIASIQQTIQADPRVQSVDSITYEGVGDNLTVKIEYTDINNQKQTFRGVM